ncbi:MAG TPA: hypothetical protein VIL55_14960, partial [Naasia sp.]
MRVLVASGSADAAPQLAALLASPRAGLVDASVALAEAAMLSTRDPAAAAERALAAGDAAAALGQRGDAREAWHEAARYGSRVAAARLLAALPRGAT